MRSRGSVVGIVNRDTASIPCRGKLFLSFSEPPDRIRDPPSLLFLEDRALFRRGWRGRSVKLSTHLHPEQSSRMIGGAPPSTLPVFMTCTGTILPFILNDTKLYNKGRKERRKEREELSETEKVFCPCVYLIKCGDVKMYGGVQVKLHSSWRQHWVVVVSFTPCQLYLQSS